jgi:hypothetical protein
MALIVSPGIKRMTRKTNDGDAEQRRDQRQQTAQDVALHRKAFTGSLLDKKL